ncbi:hypothetical protein ACOSQ2_003996 [Xanthoceras sorbifolium]
MPTTRYLPPMPPKGEFKSNSSTEEGHPTTKHEGRHRKNSATSSESIITPPVPGYQALLRRLDVLEQQRGCAEPTDRYIERSPFSWEIDSEPLPERFKMPSIPIY